MSLLHSPQKPPEGPNPYVRVAALVGVLIMRESYYIFGGLYMKGRLETIFPPYAPTCTISAQSYPRLEGNLIFLQPRRPCQRGPCSIHLGSGFRV